MCVSHLIQISPDSFLLGSHIEQKLDTYWYVLFYNCSFHSRIHWEHTNNNDDSVTFEPLKRARQVQTPVLISSVGGRSLAFAFLKSDFHYCKVGIPPRSSDFIWTFHLDHMVFCREAGRGSKICQRNIYKLTFAVGFSTNWSCLYPWVCLMTSEITQVNHLCPLPLPPDPRLPGLSSTCGIPFGFHVSPPL